MVIYIDSLILLNFIIDYLLLLTTAKISGALISRLRLAAGSLIGAVYAAAMYLPNLNFLSSIVIKLLLAAIMCAAAFGINKRLFKHFLLYMLISFLFGGAVLAVYLGLNPNGMQIINGVPYVNIGFRTLLLITALVYCVMSMVFNRTGRHDGVKGELVESVVCLNGAKINVNTLVDTGNTLSDPVNNMPVIVVEWELSKRLLPQQVKSMLNEKSFTDPVSLMEDLSYMCKDVKFRLLPYKAVGTGSGLLLAVKSDKVISGGRELKGALVAFSPTELSDGGSYRALIGAV